MPSSARRSSASWRGPPLQARSACGRPRRRPRPVGHGHCSPPASAGGPPRARGAVPPSSDRPAAPAARPAGVLRGQPEAARSAAARSRVGPGAASGLVRRARDGVPRARPGRAAAPACRSIFLGVGASSPAPPSERPPGGPFFRLGGAGAAASPARVRALRSGAVAPWRAPCGPGVGHDAAGVAGLRAVARPPPPRLSQPARPSAPPRSGLGLGPFRRRGGVAGGRGARGPIRSGGRKADRTPDQGRSG